MLPVPGVENWLAVFIGAVIAALWFAAAAVGLSFIFVRWLLPIYWSDLKSVFHRLRGCRNAIWKDAEES
jgi:hypothetical protein